MAIMDFTPVQELLGKEVCFRDLAFEKSFEEYKQSFKNDDFMNEVYLERFKFGRIAGCTVDLDEFGQLSYGILVEETYYSLNELQLLFISNKSLKSTRELIDK